MFSMVMLGLGLAPRVYAGGNLVIDGDFELADPGAPPGTDIFLPGTSIDGGFWNVIQGPLGVDVQDRYVFAGRNSVFLNGPNNGPGSLRQTVGTTPGQRYTISFWANADVDNNFAVTFGGVPVAGAPANIAKGGFPNAGWLANSGLFMFYSGTAMAVAPATDLVFTATGFPGGAGGVSVEIDDISVTVPEPSSLTLATLGAIAGLALGCLRHKLTGRSV
jgi:hypothetical protein